MESGKSNPMLVYFHCYLSPIFAFCGEFWRLTLVGVASRCCELRFSLPIYLFSVLSGSKLFSLDRDYVTNEV